MVPNSLKSKHYFHPKLLGYHPIFCTKIPYIRTRTSLKYQFLFVCLLQWPRKSGSNDGVARIGLNSPSSIHMINTVSRKKVLFNEDRKKNMSTFHATFFSLSSWFIEGLLLGDLGCLVWPRGYCLTMGTQFLKWHLFF